MAFLSLIMGCETENNPNWKCYYRFTIRDPRLFAEISLAGGVTAYEGGAICQRSILQTCSRGIDWTLATLTDYVESILKILVSLSQRVLGVLTGTLIPPAIAIVSRLLEVILSVQQGVKSVSLVMLNKEIEAKTLQLFKWWRCSQKRRLRTWVIMQ